MADVVSSCVPGQYLPRLSCSNLHFSPRLGHTERFSLRDTLSCELHSSLSFGHVLYSVSNRLLSAYAVNYVCGLVICLLLLNVPLSPYPNRCHTFTCAAFPCILCTDAITQPGGIVYGTRDSGVPPISGQIPSGYQPTYPYYRNEQYDQHQPPPASPPETQGDGAYEQPQPQGQPASTQEQPPPPHAQENYEQEQYTDPTASPDQAPHDYQEQARGGVDSDNEAHSSTIPQDMQVNAATRGQTDGIQAEEAWPKIRAEPTRAVKLEKHSWTSPLNYETTLAEWDFTMAAVPVQQHVVLVPAVPHRTGQFWHRRPLLSANFEVQFGFTVSGDETISPGQQPLQGKGFAFWYVYDEYDTALPKAATDSGDTSLFGYKSSPRGLGVFFKMYDKQGNPRPSISAVYQENGENALNALDDVPVAGGIFFRYRNLNEPVLFKVAAGPLGVVGEIRTSAMASWLRCFELKGVQLRPGGFLGFTASNGAGITASDNASASRQRPGNADLITLKFVKVWNFNLSAKGEENLSLEHALGEGEHLEDILKLHSAHKDQRELAEALRQLARVIYKHLVEHAPREEAMQQQLTGIREQLSRLELQLAQWRTELQAAMNKSGQLARAAAEQGTGASSASATDQSVHALHSVSSELFGLKNLLAKHSQLHRESMESLRKKVEAARVSGAREKRGMRRKQKQVRDCFFQTQANQQQTSSHLRKTEEALCRRHNAALPEIRELANRTRDLEASLAAKEQYSFLTMIGLILILLSLALFVWKRFRDMEKKHLL